MEQNTTSTAGSSTERSQMSVEGHADAPSDLLTEGSRDQRSTGSETPSTLGTSQISTATEQEEDVSLGTKRGRGAERRMQTMNEFELLKAGAKETSGVYLCKHCHSKKFNWENSVWNSTVAEKHLMECVLVPIEFKHELKSGSRGQQKATKLRGQMLGASDGSIMSFEASASSAGVVMPTTIMTKHKRISKKMMTNHFAPPHTRSVLSEEFANKAIRSKIEEYLAKFVSPCWILSDYAVASLLTCCGDGIQRYLPAREAVWSIVNNIDVESERHLIKMLRQQPGNLNVGFDGVTSLGKSAILYTVSKGELALFVTISHLEDKVHDTKAEIDDAVKVLSKLRRDIGSPISSAAVDNAARSVAARALDAYQELHPNDPIPLRVRDPAHCLDLVAKDFGKSNACSKVLEGVNQLVKLLSVDAVARICEVICQESTTMFFVKVVAKSETRFYGTSDEIESIYNNRLLLGTLYTHPRFEEYLSKRDTKRKETIQKAFNVITSSFWDSLKFLLKIFKPFKDAITACSREDMPMSAYYPICVCLHRDLVELLSEEPNVDELLGVPRGCIELLRLIEMRFNMDGLDPSGGKVGLLDCYQIWCFVIDPFRLYLKPRVPLGPTPAIGHLSNAVDFYLWQSEFKQLLAPTIMKEFDPIFQQLGIYMYKYRAYGEPPADNHVTASLTLDAIIQWVEQFGCVNGRLTFFCGEQYESTPYYTMIAKPLLSLKTTGSVTVKRAAKPLKHGVQTPDRNTLSHNRKIMCLRAGMNLNLKMQLRKKATK